MNDFTVGNFSSQFHLHANISIVKWSKRYFNGFIYTPTNRVLNEMELMNYLKEIFESHNIYTPAKDAHLNYSKVLFDQTINKIFSEIFKYLQPSWICWVFRYVGNGFEHNQILNNFGMGQTTITPRDVQLEEKINIVYKLFLKN